MVIPLVERYRADMSKASPDSLGLEVDASPAQRPARTILSGRLVSLVPLDVEAHAQALYEGSHGAEGDRLWLYLPDRPPADIASFKESLLRKAHSEDPMFFTIIDSVSGEAVGLTALLRIDPIHRTIEVGHILYLPKLQRKTGATEAMYLLACHIFDDLRYRRYEWKCNALNAPSRSAALRLGFTFEGIFRQHMIVKGHNRDTAWFSMLDSEWPPRKKALQRWLDPLNFDHAGRQIVTLSLLMSQEIRNTTFCP